MTTASVPKVLYQANIDLAMRIAALLQEQGRQWFDLFAQEAGMRLEQGLSHADRFRRDFSLEKLPALSESLAEHFLELDTERWQALFAQTAGHQKRFAEGLQAALQEWQAACSGAAEQMAASGAAPAAAVPSLPGLGDLLGAFERALSQVLPEAAPRPSKKPREPDSSQPGREAREPGAPASDRPVEPGVKKSAAGKPTSGAKSKAEAQASPKARTRAKATAADEAAATDRAERRSAPKKNAGRRAPVPAPSPMPALVTTPRPRGKA